VRTHLPLLTAVVFVALSAVPRAAEKDVATPFNGRTLDGWKFKNEKESEWTVGRSTLDEKDPKKLAVTPLNPAADGGPAAAELINNKTTKRGTDLYTERKFGDCLIELEFMVSKGSNSGVYVMGEYEIQILDSFGKAKVGAGDLGGLYNAAPPKVNASKKPGEWQKFVIDFRAPKFEGDKKVANAKFVKITLNGEVIHEDVEMKGPTPTGVSGKEAPTGPLMFQGDHGPVAFRNIRITPK
jgi:hypothetical protein